MSDTTYERKVAQADPFLAQELHQKRIVEGCSWAQLETEYDLSRKTILRIFKKFGLTDSVPQSGELWDKPCLRCKKKIMRPKGQWICMACKYENIDASNGLSPFYAGIV